MISAQWQTVDEVETAGRAALSAELWDGLMGGAGRELTLRRNRAALERIGLLARVLRGVSACDLSTSLMGRDLAVPLALAPIGEIGRFHADGALAYAAAAEATGAAAYVSVVSLPSLEEVRAAATTALLIFQVYMFGDRKWLASLIDRVQAAGYDALCITVDTPVSGRRDRDLHNRLDLPPIPRPNLGADEVPPYYGGTLTWDDISWIRSRTSLPIVLKGIRHPADARIAVEHGVHVVHVSNHGGQQLDDEPSTIELLSDVVAAVKGRAEVVVDSGFMRGTDVIKALALGASTVAIGRLAVLGLAAGGAQGVQRTISVLTDELRISMINLGVQKIRDLDPSVLRPTSGVASVDRL